MALRNGASRYKNTSYVCPYHIHLIPQTCQNLCLGFFVGALCTESCGLELFCPSATLTTPRTAPTGHPCAGSHWNGGLPESLIPRTEALKLSDDLAPFLCGPIILLASTFIQFRTKLHPTLDRSLVQVISWRSFFLPLISFMLLRSYEWWEEITVICIYYSP